MVAAVSASTLRSILSETHSGLKLSTDAVEYLQRLCDRLLKALDARQTFRFLEQLCVQGSPRFAAAIGDAAIRYDGSVTDIKNISQSTGMDKERARSCGKVLDFVLLRLIGSAGRIVQTQSVQSNSRSQQRSSRFMMSKIFASHVQTGRKPQAITASTLRKAIYLDSDLENLVTLVSSRQVLAKKALRPPGRFSAYVNLD